jgi:cyclopropane fatty-acyl-phospholipid synthase-like methyltransferase
VTYNYEPLFPSLLRDDFELYTRFLESCKTVWPDEQVVRSHYELDYTWVLKKLGDVNGKRILDVGAGEGRLAAHLALLGADVFAMDYRDHGWRFVQARAKGAHVNWVHCDAEDHSLKPVFDAVVCVSSFEHLPYERAHRCFSAMRRCLKPGAHMIGTLVWAPSAAYFGDANGFFPADFARVILDTGFLPARIIIPRESYWIDAWAEYKREYPIYQYMPTGFDIFVEERTNETPD